MLDDPTWHTKMLRFLRNQRYRRKKNLQVGIHLSKTDREGTEKTHMNTVKFLKEELAKIQTNRGRALDAGCGDGRLVKHVFALIFTEVDMFDPDQ